MSHPILVTTHHLHDQIQHYAWSPEHYAPSINVHPLLNQDYENFVNRVIIRINDENLGELLYSHTDFHSNTLINDRMNTAYFAVYSNHVVSPVYFNVVQANNYVVDHPSHNQIAGVPHRIV
jgi:hypothetical protein